jgi:hypothetical protein
MARRFSPAMALPEGGIPPVDVSYMWSDGADLVAEARSGSGRIVSRRVAVPNAELSRRPWADLPARDAAGRTIRYTIDGPGDDRADARGRTRWQHRFAAHADGAGRPTQYAHLFWFNRAEGLLGIQYWFFYPYNQWVNHHEGDWEHINVILRGPTALTAESAATFEPVGYQFFFHSFSLETSDVVRVAGQDGGDHVLVFAGGAGRLLAWSGVQSGASYPLPAVYRGAGSGPLPPDEDTRRPARFLPPEAFDVVFLPEPERLDAQAHPELSWLRLDFWAGQETVETNPPFVNLLGFGGPTRQPARRRTWNAVESRRSWGHASSVSARRIDLPAGWKAIAAPWLGSTLAVAAPRTAR